MANGPQRLIVVSNRGPLRSATSGGRRRWVRSAGGLVAALDPVLRGRGGVWVSAKEAEDFPTQGVQSPELGYETAAVRLTRTVQNRFYGGFSNALLWPLLHSFPPTIRVGEAPWNEYVLANRAFADRVLDVSTGDDAVWIQDYHLMLVPGNVRTARPNVRLGWFCHVPWPNSDLFRVLPWRQEILEGLLGADILAFHTDTYVHNFLRCCERLTGHPVDHEKRTVSFQGRRVQVFAAPIGSPVAELRKLAADPAIADAAQDIRDSVRNRRIILGVDRLDYTKGIPERLLGYERFLRRDPGATSRVVFVQVMVPSRTDVEAYASLKSEIDRLVGSINGRFGRAGRTPVHYIYRNLDQRTLFAHYRAADVALITPLRDGMNLVAHEFVVSRVEHTGALILSEFAGAAEYLKDAIQVNPYDIASISDALALSFSLRPEERTRMMQALQTQAEALDVHRWADGFLERLVA